MKKLWAAGMALAVAVGTLGSMTAMAEESVEGKVVAFIPKVTLSLPIMGLRSTQKSGESQLSTWEMQQQVLQSRLRLSTRR